MSREADILLDVLDLEVEARAAVLDRECGADADLRERVERLIALSESDRVGFLDRGVILGQSDRLSSLERIGAYSLERVIGSGSSGVVFEAKQDSPQRLVAVKLLRWGAASSASTARFGAESELLGRLIHPGIAAVYESGIEPIDSSWSQPFIAMELVDGVPLDEHARASLSARGFLKVMVDVCDAVHHAHQRGVIHGDLKPSNILVRKDGAAKVIDFGVGRVVGGAIEHEDSSHGSSTLGFGTPRFMSPEQLAGSADGDTRSDVFALGVVLHYVLTGRFPGEKPLAPRTWLHAETDRSLEGARDLSRASDLGRIVAKAIAPDPADRYDSAARLADDLRALASLRPVSTSPPSPLGIASLFARRNPALASVLVALFAIVTLAIGGVSWGYAKAVSSEREARRALADANDVAGALHELIAGGRYERSEGQVSVADLLEQGERSVETSDIRSPQLRAKLYHTLARGYDSIAMHERCLRCAERGLEILGVSNAEEAGVSAIHLELLHLRGVTLQEVGKPRDALGIHRGVLAQLNADPDARRDDVMRSSIAIGLTHQQLGEYGEAERWLRGVFDEASDEYGPAHQTTRSAASNLALTLQSAGRASEAVPFAEQAYEGAAALYGHQDQRVLRSGNTLAWAYMSADRTDDAARLLNELLTLIRDAYGPDSDWLPGTAHTLGVLQLNTGDYEGSVETLGTYREAAHRAHPEGSWQRGVYEGCYANGLIGVGRYQDAVPVLLGALGDLESTVGLDHHNAQHSIELLVRAYTELGRDAEAGEWRAKLD